MMILAGLNTYQRCAEYWRLWRAAFGKGADDLNEVELALAIEEIQNHYATCDNCRRWLQLVSEAGKGSV
jgi:hypothetical protein